MLPPVAQVQSKLRAILGSFPSEKPVESIVTQALKLYENVQDVIQDTDTSGASMLDRVPRVSLGSAANYLVHAIADLDDKVRSELSRRAETSVMSVYTSIKGVASYEDVAHRGSMGNKLHLYYLGLSDEIFKLMENDAKLRDAIGRTDKVLMDVYEKMVASKIEKHAAVKAQANRKRADVASRVEASKARRKEKVPRTAALQPLRSYADGAAESDSDDKSDDDYVDENGSDDDDGADDGVPASTKTVSKITSKTNVETMAKAKAKAKAQVVIKAVSVGSATKRFDIIITENRQCTLIPYSNGDIPTYSGNAVVHCLLEDGQKVPIVSTWGSYSVTNTPTAAVESAFQDSAELDDALVETQALAPTEEERIANDAIAEVEEMGEDPADLVESDDAIMAQVDNSLFVSLQEYYDIQDSKDMPTWGVLEYTRAGSPEIKHMTITFHPTSTVSTEGDKAVPKRNIIGFECADRSMMWLKGHVKQRGPRRRPLALSTVVDAIDLTATATSVPVVTAASSTTIADAAQWHTLIRRYEKEKYAQSSAIKYEDLEQMQPDLLTLTSKHDLQDASTLPPQLKQHGFIGVYQEKNKDGSPKGGPHLKFVPPSSMRSDSSGLGKQVRLGAFEDIEVANVIGNWLMSMNSVLHRVPQAGRHLINILMPHAITLDDIGKKLVVTTQDADTGFDDGAWRVYVNAQQRHVCWGSIGPKSLAGTIISMKTPEYFSTVTIDTGRGKKNTEWSNPFLNTAATNSPSQLAMDLDRILAAVDETNAFLDDDADDDELMSAIA